MESNEELIAYLKAQGYIKSKAVEEAFRKVDRARFVPPKWKNYAYEDMALPIAEGSTISAPGVVAAMLEMLKAEKGMKVLEIGSGSGYSACLLSAMGCKVYSMDISEEVIGIAKENAKGCKGVEFILGDGKKGYAKEAPYDRILVNARATIRREWLKQLSEEGKLVLPLAMEGFERLARVNKQGEIEELGMAVVFVPLL